MSGNFDFRRSRIKKLETYLKKIGPAGSLGHPEVEPTPGPGPRLSALMEPELRATGTFQKH